MATAVHPDGKKHKIEPKNGKAFTLYEISEFLNGIIEPAFAAEYWVFTNKLGQKLGFSYNKKCSELFGYPIFGICLIVEENELPTQFFLPEEPPAYYTELLNQLKSSQQSQESQNYSHKEEKDIIDDIREKEIKKQKAAEKMEQMEPYFYSSYDLLFKDDKPFEEVIDNFVIYEDNNERIFINNNDKILKFLNKMMEFFQIKEEYEKCSSVSKLIKYMEQKK